MGSSGKEFENTRHDGRGLIKNMGKEMDFIEMRMAFFTNLIINSLLG